MMRLVPILAAALATATPLAAETPMGAEAFDAYTRGKTLFYGSGGQAYGVERYLDNRRVVWSFLDGKCKYGLWYEAEGEICFVYEDRPDPQCWTFTKGPDGLIAQFETETRVTRLYEAREGTDEMICHGPDTGV
ncbi:MAG: hypothetical protein NXH82_03025 [Rhodobacteraceae bacterium]|nr:hypothetical protein [Paracoccaceae bacterium]